jgi:hypothetical protein
MANQASNSPSGRVPRSIPQVTAEEAHRNALELAGGTLPADPIAALKASSPIPIPDEPGAQCDAFLAHILRPGRLYCLVLSKGYRPDFPGAIFEKDELLCPQYQGVIPSAIPGGYLRFNPVAGPGSGKGGCHRDCDIVGFDYVLVESDSLPLELQAALIPKLVELGIPVASAVHTGGKSIHALIRVNAADHTEFRAVARRIYARLVTLGADPSTSNPSRMSRLPGCVRTFPDKSTALQQLLYLA